eukprot:6123822-Amphidinium_carterae.1
MAMRKSIPCAEVPLWHPTADAEAAPIHLPSQAIRSPRGSCAPRPAETMYSLSTTGKITVTQSPAVNAKQTSKAKTNGTVKPTIAKHGARPTIMRRWVLTLQN